MRPSDYLTKLESKWAEEDKLYALPTTNETLPFLFLPKVMTESLLPRTRTKDREINRSYQNVKITVRTIDGGTLPFGAVARKLLLFFSTRAIQEKNRHIFLGMSERELMDNLGIARNHKASLNLRHQVRRLSKLTCEIHYEPRNGRKIEYQGVIFSQIALEKDDKQLPLWASEVVFSHDYFEAIGKRANPFNTAQIAGIESAFALDLFLWLAIRLPRAKRERQWLDVSELMAQFAFGSTNKYTFSKSLQRALKSVRVVFPGAREAVKWDAKRFRLGISYTSDLVDLKQQSYG